MAIGLGWHTSFPENKFLSGELMEKFRKGHWACCVETPPTPEEMKSQFTFYHVLMLLPELGHISMIPAEGLQHSPH
jgi:hypothetical protein